MTGSNTPSGSGFVSTCRNPAFDCGGADVRAQCRHMATVVTIAGVIDVENIEMVSEYTRRFILVGKPVVLDLSDVKWFGAQAISLLYVIEEACSAAGVEWALIASDAVVEVLRVRNEEDAFPLADSMPHALHDFADASLKRRRLLLPLLTKTA